jgi:hypothetical protein
MVTGEDVLHIFVVPHKYFDGNEKNLINILSMKLIRYFKASNNPWPPNKHS